MNVIIKSHGGHNEHTVEAFLRSGRVVYLEGDIDGGMAMDFCRQIAFFRLSDNRKPVKVFINSAGGEIDAGMAIVDTIRSAGLPIETYCLMHAYSMAAVIFACGTHGRYLLEHAKVMIHEPLVMTGGPGKTSTIAELAEDLLQTKKKMDTILAELTGQTLEKVAERTSRDSFFEGAAAVEFGLADGVMTYEQMLEGVEV